jgi:hypothetical protein
MASVRAGKTALASSARQRRIDGVAAIDAQRKERLAFAARGAYRSLLNLR